MGTSQHGMYTIDSDAIASFLLGPIWIVDKKGYIEKQKMNVEM